MQTCLGGQCMSVFADRAARKRWQRTPVAGCRARGLRTGYRPLDHPDSERGQESAYRRRVLPIGVFRNFGRGLHDDVAALACAGLIVAGLAVTATGFLKIRWTRPAGPPQEVGSTPRNSSADAAAAAVLLLVIEGNSPVGAVDARKAGDSRTGPFGYPTSTVTLSPAPPSHWCCW